MHEQPEQPVDRHVQQHVHGERDDVGRHEAKAADPRFQQVRLGLSPGTEILAKSLPGSTVRQVLAAEGKAGLPARWRHEQRSVADAWDLVHAEPGIDPLLALRLVGTSHGHGRSSS